MYEENNSSKWSTRKKERKDAHCSDIDGTQIRGRLFSEMEGEKTRDRSASEC